MKHTKEEQLHNSNFSLERMALFTDAVFAIAITLLILEIKIPEIHDENITDNLLMQGLLSIMPRFIGFLVSFYVIGVYWLSHHRMSNYLVRSNRKFLWNNLLFLLPIVIMPFSTAFISEYYTGTLRLPLVVYSANICLTGFFSFRLWRIIGNPANHLITDINSVVLRYNKTRAIAVPVFFIIAVLISVFSITAAYIFLPFTVFAGKLIRVYFFKKYPKIMETQIDQ